jgi:hypothetical protein
LELRDFGHALSLEWLITHGKNLVDQKQIGVHMNGHRKRQSHVHTGTLKFDLGVNKVFDTGEIYNLIKVSVCFVATKAENRGIEIDILTAGEVRVKTRA